MGRGNLEIGRIGEKAAIKFLKKRGYRILATNFRTVFGELDAVARYGSVIIFVEIKTRSTDSLGPGYLSVTRAKQRHIIKNALLFLKMRRLKDVDWRVDVVSVRLDVALKVRNIELIENAVEDYHV